MPPFSESETEVTRMLSQYSSVMVCVDTIILLILAMVWCLRTCEFVVINKCRLLTCQRGGIKNFHRFAKR